MKYRNVIHLKSVVIHVIIMVSFCCRSLGQAQQVDNITPTIGCLNQTDAQTYTFNSSFGCPSGYFDLTIEGGNFVDGGGNQSSTCRVFANFPDFDVIWTSANGTITWKSCVSNNDIDQTFSNTHFTMSVSPAMSNINTGQIVTLFASNSDTYNWSSDDPADDGSKYISNSSNQALAPIINTVYKVAGSLKLSDEVTCFAEATAVVNVAGSPTPVTTPTTTPTGTIINLCKTNCSQPARGSNSICGNQTYGSLVKGQRVSICPLLGSAEGSNSVGWTYSLEWYGNDPQQPSKPWGTYVKYDNSLGGSGPVPDSYYGFAVPPITFTGGTQTIFFHRDFTLFAPAHQTVVNYLGLVKPATPQISSVNSSNYVTITLTDQDLLDFYKFQLVSSNTTPRCNETVLFSVPYLSNATYSWIVNGVSVPSQSPSNQLSMIMPKSGSNTVQVMVSPTDGGFIAKKYSKEVTVQPIPPLVQTPLTMYVDKPAFPVGYVGSNVTGSTWSGPGVDANGLFTAASAGVSVPGKPWVISQSLCGTTIATLNMTVNPLAVNTTTLSFKGGAGDKITIPTGATSSPFATGSPFGVSSFTFETWIKFDKPVNGDPIILQYLDALNSGISFKMAEQGTKLLVSYVVNNGTSSTSQTIISNAFPSIYNDGLSHHLAVTHNGAVGMSGNPITFYLDGQPVGGGSTIFPIINQDKIHILTLGSYLNGVMDEFSYWNIYKTQANILSDMAGPISPTATGLVGYWDLNEGGDIVYDKSPSKANGLWGQLGSDISPNGPIRSNDPCYPVITSKNSALNFNSSSQKYATVPFVNSYSTSVSSDFTLEAVVNIPAAGATNWPVIFSNQTMDKYGFTWFIKYGTYLGLDVKTGAERHMSNAFPSIYDGKCHYLALTRSNGVITFYVDGVNVGTGTCSVSLANAPGSTQPFRVGGAGLTGSYTAYNGYLNEIRIWNSNRSSSIGTTFTTIGTPTAFTNLLGYWSFDETNPNQTIIDKSVVSNNGYLGNSNSIDAYDPARNIFICFTNDRQSDVEGTTRNVILGAEPVSVYPSPFISEFFITNLSGETPYRITSLEGKELMNGTAMDQQQVVFPSQFPSGIYLLNLEDPATGTKVIKISKH
jgi:hypothetical protein